MNPVAFNPDAHEYTLEGEIYPHVTQILSDMGLYEIPYGATDYHRERGRILHSGTDLIDRGVWDEATTSPVLVPRLRAYRQFLADTGFETKLNERPLACRQRRFAGTLDKWGMMPDRKRWLIDLKNGEPPPSVHVQTALYEYLILENLRLPTDMRVSVWLRDDGTYRVIEPNGSKQQDLSIGLSAVSLWHWRRNHGLLKNKEGKH